MAIDFGVSTDLYIEGLVTELANIFGKSDEEKTHRAAVEAELAVARSQPAAVDVPVEVFDQASVNP